MKKERISFKDLTGIQAKKMVADEMKSIRGGAGTCGVAIWSGGPGGSWMTGCGMSKSEVMSFYSEYSGPKNWCCDSCGSTWYCGGEAVHPML